MNSFLERFNGIVRQVQAFAFFVRGQEIQEASITTLKDLLSECTTQKRRAIAEQNESDANAYLALEFMTKALIEEFRFYLALKRDAVGAAWDHLVNAQTAVANAMKSHQVASNLGGQHYQFQDPGHKGEDEKDFEFGGYLGRLHLLERLLFPKPTFFSSGLIVRESQCSICASQYEECDHVKGRPYMGELCARVITKCEVLEVSAVSNPADKRARVLSYSDGDGQMRDSFTGRKISGEDVQSTNGEGNRSGTAMPDNRTLS